MTLTPGGPLPQGGNFGPGGSGWREEYCSSSNEALRIIHGIVDQLIAAEFPKSDQFSFRLALEEAIINAIKHGNNCDPAKKVRVGFLVTAEQVVAEIEDDGPGFNPQRVPDPTAPENLEHPGGRGLFLIRAYTTWLCFNDRGNKVTFCKTRSPS